MSNERDFKGVWIKKEIWTNKDMTWIEKLLYSLLECEEINLGSDKEIAFYMNMSPSNVSIVKKRLIEKGYLTNIKFKQEEIVNLLKGKNLKNKGIGKKECEWCKINTEVLHEHHYPIRKEHRGIEVVKICPNCHHEFHKLENGKIETCLPNDRHNI